MEETDKPLTCQTRYLDKLVNGWPKGEKWSNMKDGAAGRNENRIFGPNSICQSYPVLWLKGRNKHSESDHDRIKGVERWMNTVEKAAIKKGGGIFYRNGSK